MSAKQGQEQIEQLFLYVLDMTPQQREAFLQTCANTNVRKEVEALLAAYDQSNNFLETPLVSSVVSDNSPDLLIGRTLGDFRIENKIGEGAFGVVYRAEQITLMREVIVKVLHQKHRDNHDVIDRFLREARLASWFSHPYSAHVYAFGAESDGLLWIAMEFVYGTPLDKLLRTQGPLELERFVPLLDKICEVVHSAHDKGVVHRDLKPANVMVISRAGRLLPKLLDFGIAKTLDQETNYIAKLEIENDEKDVSTDDSNKTTGLLGSTPYMPAEQWENAAQVDTRADIYALGVFAYEMLTGRRPFSGGSPTSFYTLYKAHKEMPVPALGNGFPPALDPVIAKAMAKNPQDRFNSAIDFATAFRTASGISLEEGVLPQLDTKLYEKLLATAPQPIATTIARFGAARSLHQSRERMLSIVRVIVRYLGLLALAARAQIGSGRKKDSEKVFSILKRLRCQELTDFEWYELTVELASAFALKRDAYPIPELVSLFFEPSSTNKTQLNKVLVNLLELQTASLLGATEEQVQQDLAKYLPEITNLLQSVSFLQDYVLVVKRNDYVEKWMGNERANLSLQLQKLEIDRPALIDSNGRVVLSLWPFIQVVEPLPNVREELFFLSGRGRHTAAKLIALPTGFERQDEVVWEWFEVNFFKSNAEFQSDNQPGKTPYLGLTTFTSADADLFFGRERDTEAFLNRLRVQPLLALIGASGAGKSSFLQAGVFPELPKQWQTITVRPGVTPVNSLLAKLKKDFGKIPEELNKNITTDSSILGKYLRSIAEKANSTLLIFVDQFEELFTLCPSLTERQFYASMLANAACSPEEPVRVVLALRDDFLIRAKQLPGLRERLSHGLEVLTTPALEDLLRILITPAERSGYQFEDEALPREIVAAVADQAGALPLLAFTAAKLWELRDRGFKQLRRKTYLGMGGVGGALAQHAESMLAAMSVSEQRLVREAFRQLVTSEGTRASLTQTELIHLLGSSEEAKVVLEKLIASRLLVVSEGELAQERVEIVHEALLLAWPRLIQWQQEEKENTRLRDQLRIAAKQWDERGRVKGLLWRDEALTEYQLWRSRYSGKLTELEEAFAQASLSEARRGLRRTRIIVSVILLGLVSGLIILFYQRQLTQEAAHQTEEYAHRVEEYAHRALEEKNRAEESTKEATYEKTVADQQRQLAEANALEATEQTSLAKENSERAERQLLELYEERGRQEILLGNPVLASLYLSEAYRLGKTNASLKYLLAESMRALDAQQVSLNGHNKEVYLAEFSPDATKVVTAGRDNTARIWRSDNGQQLVSLQGYTGGEPSARFNPNGTLIAIAATNNSAQVFNALDGHLRYTLSGHKAVVVAVRFSPDGSQILTASRDGTTKIWDANTGKLVNSLDKETSQLYTAEFDTKGTKIATATDSGVKIWDFSGQLLATLVGHSGHINSVSFNPDSTKIVTTSDDATAKIWDVSTGNLLASLEGHKGNVYWAEFNSAGNKVVTASSDNTAKIWDAASGKLIVSLDGHLEIVNTAHFTPDGTRVLTSSNDFTAKVWDSISGLLLATFQGHKGNVYTASISRNGKKVVTASSDGTAKIWNTNYDKLKSTFEASRTQALFGLFTPQGARIITADNDDRVKIWDANNNKLVTTLALSVPGLTLAEFNPSGSHLVTVGDNDLVKVWEVSTGKQLFAVDGYVASFSYNGQYLVTVTRDKNIKIWDSSNGKIVKSFPNTFALVSSIHFSHDGNRLVTAGKDRIARVWQVSTGKVLSSFAGHQGIITAAEFSIDGTKVATASEDNTVKIWDSNTGKLQLSLEGHKGRVYFLSFSQDNTRLITSSGDKTVKLWDVATGRLLASIEGHRSTVYSADFSLDGKQLITTSRDKTVKLWDVSLESRSAKEISSLVNQLVPFHLDEGRLIPNKLNLGNR